MIGDSRDNGGWVDSESQHEGNRLSDWKAFFTIGRNAEIGSNIDGKARCALCRLPRPWVERIRR